MFELIWEQVTGSRCSLLHGHLGDGLEGDVVCFGKGLFVLAHLDGLEPLVHGAEAGEVWRGAVQQR